MRDLPRREASIFGGVELRVLVHDFAGHPFQMELSKELANRGHEVFHAYFNEDPGPKGVMVNYSGIVGSVRVIPISIGRAYSKGALARRFLDDLRYREAAKKALEGIQVDLVVSSNCPSWVQGAFMDVAKDQGAKFLYWCQDFYSIAVESYLCGKSQLIGYVVGMCLRALDRFHMKNSDHVVHITDAFKAITDQWGICDSRVSIIPNWGAIAEIPVTKKENSWAQAHGINSEQTTIIYSGTLGLKHSPGLLRYAARALPYCNFIIVGSGVGFDQLKEEVSDNLILLPLQEFEVYPDVLGSADILIGMIEPDAGRFSVPSKILSYLCACRPIVLSAPSDNLAAMIINSEGAGIITCPGDADGFVSAITQLLDNTDMAASMGKRGRAYAEHNFDITKVGSRFETLFKNILAGN